MRKIIQIIIEDIIEAFLYKKNWKVKEKIIIDHKKISKINFIKLFSKYRIYKVNKIYNYNKFISDNYII